MCIDNYVISCNSSAPTSGIDEALGIFGRHLCSDSWRETDDDDDRMEGHKELTRIYEGLVRQLLQEREGSYYKITLIDIRQYAVGEEMKECAFCHVSEDTLTKGTYDLNSRRSSVLKFIDAFSVHLYNKVTSSFVNIYNYVLLYCNVFEDILT